MSNNYPPGYDGSLDGGTPDTFASKKNFNDDLSDSVFDALPTWAQSIQRRKEIEKRTAFINNVTTVFIAVFVAICVVIILNS